MFGSEIFPRILKELCHKIGHNADGGSAYYVVVLLSDSVRDLRQKLSLGFV